MEIIPQAHRLLSIISVTKKIYHPSYVSMKRTLTDKKKSVNPLHNNDNVTQPSALLITDVVQRDFENCQTLAKSMQGHFDAVHNTQHRRSELKLPENSNRENHVQIKLHEIKKSKSDMCLELDVPKYSKCYISNSLHNQRVSNMINSMQNIKVASLFPIIDHRAKVAKKIVNIISCENLQHNDHFWGEGGVSNEKVSKNILHDCNLPVENARQVSSCQNRELHNDSKTTRINVGCFEQSVAPYKFQNPIPDRETIIEPDSPCSITPFIMPSRKRSTEISDDKHKTYHVGSLYSLLDYFLSIIVINWN